MNWRVVLLWVGGAVLVAAAWRSYGWPGVALVLGGLVFWLLLHYTRLLQVLKRAADRPLGYVDSSVMLNAKLKPGMSLLHVVAMTRALGQQLSPVNEQPELFRWTDNGESHVTCEFLNGRLVRWELVRPGPAQEPAALQQGPAKP